MSLVFKPVGILTGVLAGLLGKKLFMLVRGLLDDQPPPEPSHRRLALGKLAAALVLEGAIFRLLRGFAEHGARHGFSALTGQWPAEGAAALGWQHCTTCTTAPRPLADDTRRSSSMVAPSRRCRRCRRHAAGSPPDQPTNTAVARRPSPRSRAPQ